MTVERKFITLDGLQLLFRPDGTPDYLPRSTSPEAAWMRAQEWLEEQHTDDRRYDSVQRWVNAFELPRPKPTTEQLLAELKRDFNLKARPLRRAHKSATKLLRGGGFTEDEAQHEAIRMIRVFVVKSRMPQS